MDDITLTPEWTQLMTTPAEQHVPALFNYCQTFIDQHADGSRRPEEIGHAIYQLQFVGFKEIPADIQEFIQSAHDLEISRDTKEFFGEGTWSEEEADAKKENQFDEFVAQFEALKETYSSES